MAGLNRTEAETISSRNLETLLEAFAAVQSDIANKQLQLLAELVLKFKKAPSIFKIGGTPDILKTYPLINDSSAYATSIASLLQGGLPTTVAVIPIEDADIVRLTLLLSWTQFVIGGAPVILYALSPSQTHNPTPLSQFGLISNMRCGAATNFVGSGATPPYNNVSSTWVNVTEDIPCAGNKMLYLAGKFVNGELQAEDLVTSLLPGGGTTMLSYKLIK